MTTANYTKVPLRRGDRWTGARLQQGQSLLEHEANLTLDALSRADRDLARDAIGWAGVVAGSTAFQVTVLAGPPVDLAIAPGRMWVDGLEALAPEPFRYSEQDGVPPLPGGRVFVYLDAFVEHVQPAELPDELVDPAISPVETAARQRVGWRVRAVPTNAATCEAAFAALQVPATTGRLTIDRTAAPGPADPCDPPGDPLGVVPDGLFRVEVLDPGTRSTARFAWSYDNGGSAVALAGPPVGAVVTLRPSASVKFAAGDKVEVSWLTRRADGAAHGALYTVTGPPAGGAAGQVLTLDRPVAVPAGASGLCVRRWDGDVVGAVATRSALLGTVDLGVEFSASAGDYRAGDWWGARLRSAATPVIERRLAAEADGIAHAFAPLALVDFGTGTVDDCRPSFTSLVDLEPVQGQGVCTVTVFPGDDLQAAVDSLPADGGELCIAAGTYDLREPVRFRRRSRIVVSGTGPATFLRARDSEAVLLFDRCTDVEVRHLRAESGPAGEGTGEHLGGVLTFVGCVEVRVADCDLTCPDALTTRTQSCVNIRTALDPAGTRSDRVRVEGNRCEVGAWQTGVLVVDALEVAVTGNVVRFTPAAPRRGVFVGGSDFIVNEVAAALARDVGSNKPTLASSKAASTFAVRFANANATSRRAGFRAFVENTVEARPSKARTETLALIRSLRAGGQGIVVGGTRVGTVRVSDNLVDGFVQGIHVGASHAAVKGREIADAVYVSGNVVHCLVPPAYNRGRHAVFVGNARSVHVVDTVATLRRTAQGTIPNRAQTPVDGIVVHGTLGPFLTIRQSSLRAFATGVRVTPVAPSAGEKRRMWLVAETMAELSGIAVDAPDCEQERNYG